MYYLTDYDKDYYCTGMNIDANGHIQWNSGRGVETLIVAVPYELADGQNPDNIYQRLCDRLNRSNPVISNEEYINIGEGMLAKIVSQSDKAKENGSHIYVSGKMYLIAPIMERGEDIFIYRSRKNDLSVLRSSPLRLEYEIGQGSYRIGHGGLFAKREVITYYTITFKPMFKRGYEDGLLVYRFGDDRIPVSQQMIGNGIIYINSFHNELPRPVVERTSDRIEIYGR